MRQVSIALCQTIEVVMATINIIIDVLKLKHFESLPINKNARTGRENVYNEWSAIV